MHDLASLPPSIRRQYEQAQALEAQGNHSGSEIVLQEMARTLASTQPKLCAMILASALGIKELNTYAAKQDKTVARTERNAFGFQIGYDVTTTTYESVEESRFWTVRY